jgi:hypothetical protein
MAGEAQQYQTDCRQTQPSLTMKWQLTSQNIGFSWASVSMAPVKYTTATELIQPVGDLMRMSLGGLTA